MARTHSSFSAQRGAVVVLVLVTLLLASFLLMAFIRRSGTELLADARAAERRQLRGEAYSALESAIAMLAAQRDIDGALFKPDENWPEMLAATGYTPVKGLEVKVAFVDESGKISLPTADAVTLQTALETAGVDQGAAEKTANALLAWMRKGDTNDSADPDSPDYSRNDPAYGPARRAIVSWTEFGAMEMDRHIFYDEDGRPTEALRRFMQDFSLHAFQHSNLNTASSTVLATLGLGTDAVSSLESYRSQPKRSGQSTYFRSLTEASTVLGPAANPDHFSTAIEILRINITVRHGALAQRLTAVIAPPNAGNRSRLPAQSNQTPGNQSQSTQSAGTGGKVLNYPFSIVEIHEDIEAPEIAAAPTP